VVVCMKPPSSQEGTCPLIRLILPVIDDGDMTFILDHHFTSVCDPHKTNDVKSFCGETLDIVSVGKVDLRLPVSEGMSLSSPLVFDPATTFQGLHIETPFVGHYNQDPSLQKRTKEVLETRPCS